MGSIVAYDVMTQYAPDVSIDTFVTIGSPLGLPIIKSKIVAERKKSSPPKMTLKRLKMCCQAGIIWRILETKSRSVTT